MGQAGLRTGTECPEPDLEQTIAELLKQLHSNLHGAANREAGIQRSEKNLLTTLSLQPGVMEGHVFTAHCWQQSRAPKPIRFPGQRI